MIDFLSQHQLYIVLSIILLIWAGIVWYLFRIDRRITQLEDQSKKG